MENFPLSYSPIAHLNPENTLDAKSRFWPISSHAASIAEIVCPTPHRATMVKKFGPKAKALPVRSGYHCTEFMEDFLVRDELEIDSDASTQIGGFLRGSPPVRSHNPVVHDTEFKRLNLAPSPPSLLGAGPEVRVEGFACGSPETRAIPAIA